MTNFFPSVDAKDFVARVCYKLSCPRLCLYSQYTKVFLGLIPTNNFQEAFVGVCPLTIAWISNMCSRRLPDKIPYILRFVLRNVSPQLT